MNDVKRFTDEIDAALHKHAAWTLRLRAAMHNGKSDITPNQAACDHACDFGRWLHGPAIPYGLKCSGHFKTIARMHADFHVSAARVLIDATAGRKDLAKQTLAGDFQSRSTRLMRALQEWKAELLRLSPEAARAILHPSDPSTVVAARCPHAAAARP